MDIRITCKEARQTANNYKLITLDIEQVEASEILDHFSLHQVLEYFGAEQFLDEIGIEEAKSYFDLKESE